MHTPQPRQRQPRQPHSTLYEERRYDDRLDIYLSVTHSFANKSVSKYTFSYSSFHAEHDGDIYFHVQQFLQKLEGLLQHHVSPFIPPPLSCTITVYSVLRSKTEYKNMY